MVRGLKSLVHFIFVSLIFSSCPIHAGKYTPTKDEKIRVKCSCILSTSLCRLKTFDEAAGKPRQEWEIDQYGKAGREIDLNAACWRKRDSENMGEDLCCLVDGDEKGTIERLFSGVKLD